MSVFELTSIAALAVQALLFWIILPLRSAVDALRVTDEQNYKELKGDMQSLQVEVAKNYVQRGEVTASLSRMESKIDMLSANLIKRTEDLEQSKVDK
jgi:septal ring factor EnvC (AmiA/AmiB activator)